MTFNQLNSEFLLAFKNLLQVQSYRISHLLIQIYFQLLKMSVTNSRIFPEQSNRAMPGNSCQILTVTATPASHNRHV